MTQIMVLTDDIQKWHQQCIKLSIAQQRAGVTQCGTEKKSDHGNQILT